MRMSPFRSLGMLALTALFLVGFDMQNEVSAQQRHSTGEWRLGFERNHARQQQYRPQMQAEGRRLRKLSRQQDEERRRNPPSRRRLTGVSR